MLICHPHNPKYVTHFFADGAVNAIWSMMSESRFGVRVLSLYKWPNENDNLLTDTRKAFALPPRAKTEYGSWTKRKDDSRYLVLSLPMGLNSPIESEFQFSYFSFLLCPSGNLRDLII